MTKPAIPSFEPVLRMATAYWATAALGTALAHSVFEHLEEGPLTVEEFAAKANVAKRGARLLLESLTGFGILLASNDRYRNTPEASTYLVKGKPTYFGDFAKLNFDIMPEWVKLPEAVTSGTSVMSLSSVPNNPYWDRLVVAIAPISMPAAHLAASHLRIAEQASLSMLEVAGGAATFAAVFLAANPKATATQIDWENVNRIARQRIDALGLGDRFHTRDGEFLAVDYGEAAYDIVIYSHMAHGVSKEENIEAFKKIRRALKPGGTLVINEFFPNDDGTAHPFILAFGANLLFHSKTGICWRDGEYREWLTNAGFTSFEMVETGTPAALMIAR